MFRLPSKLKLWTEGTIVITARVWPAIVLAGSFGVVLSIIVGAN